MARIANVASSFLDGFGALSAILEPTVRPGSQDNLIQQRAEHFPDDGFEELEDPAGDMLIWKVLQSHKRATIKLNWTIASIAILSDLIVWRVSTRFPSLSLMDWLFLLVPMILIAIFSIFQGHQGQKDFTKIAELLARGRGGSRATSEKAHYGARERT